MSFSVSNPLKTDDTPVIHMICLVRYSDKAVVASLAFSDEGKISVEGVRECVAGNSGALEPGRRFLAQGDTFCIFYQIDEQVKRFIQVADLEYQS